MKTFKDMVVEKKGKMVKCQGFKCGQMVPEEEVQERWGKYICKKCQMKDAKAVSNARGGYSRY